MSIDNALNWYESLKDDIDYKVERNKNAFAALLNTLMVEQGISQAELAKRIEKRAPYISKIMRGDENCTISSMTKLLDAIDCELHINACHKNHSGRWFNIISGGQTADLNTASKEITALWAKQVRHGEKAA